MVMADQSPKTFGTSVQNQGKSPIHPLLTLPKRRPTDILIFPGSPTSDTAHIQSKSWNESEWID